MTVPVSASQNQVHTLVTLGKLLLNFILPCTPLDFGRPIFWLAIRWADHTSASSLRSILKKFPAWFWSIRRKQKYVTRRWTTFERGFPPITLRTGHVC